MISIKSYGTILETLSHAGYTKTEVKRLIKQGAITQYRYEITAKPWTLLWFRAKIWLFFKKYG